MTHGKCIRQHSSLKQCLVKQTSTCRQHACLHTMFPFCMNLHATVASVLHVNQAQGHARSKRFCRGHTEKAMANWLAAVGFWESQALRRIFTAWRTQGGQKVLKALAHWETSQSGTGPAFRWWRRVVQHLHEADQQAQQHRHQHACRAAFQARMHTPFAACCPAFLHTIPSGAGSKPSIFADVQLGGICPQLLPCCSCTLWPCRKYSHLVKVTS